MDSKLSKRALKLSYFTIIYNIAEGILSIFAGLIAGSISFVWFGLDSAVESLSAVVVAWRFRKHGKIDKREEEEVEERAFEISDFGESKIEIFDNFEIYWIYFFYSGNLCAI